MNNKFLFISFLLIISAGVYLLWYNAFSITFCLVQDKDLDLKMPTIEDGKELRVASEKYSNNGGIITSSQANLNCRWKDPLDDDGYKICEALFEIVDMTSHSRYELESPSVEANFLKDTDIRKLEILYSNTYKISKKEYLEEDYSIRNTGGKVSISQDASNNTNKKIVSTRKTKVNKKDKFEREFNEFFEIESKGLEEPKLLQGENIDNDSSINESSDIIGNDNLTDPSANSSDNEENNLGELTVEDIPNESSEGVSHDQGLSGEEIISPLGGFESDQNNSQSSNILNGLFTMKFNSDRIDTSSPFAVLVKFEIPKYEEASFNFSISDNDFKASLDPEVLGCGILNVEDSVYILDQNISSSSSCFSIEADNITLDCLGNNISFGEDEDQSYGVYINSSNVEVRNCNFVKESLTDYGSGILAEGSDNISISNNSFRIDGQYTYAVRMEHSKNVNVSNNNLITYGDYENAIYFYLDEENSSISNNFIETFGFGSSGIFLDLSTGVSIYENQIKSSSEQTGLIYTASSDELKVYSNNISLEGEQSIALYLDSISNSKFLTNSVWTNEIGDLGIYTYQSFQNIFQNNFIDLENPSGSGYTISDGSFENLIDSDLIYSRGESSIGITFENSFSSTLKNVSITTYEQGGHAIILQNSSNNSFDNLYVETLNEESYGVSISQFCYGNNISGSYIKTSEDYSYPIYLSYIEPGFNIMDSTLYSVQGEPSIYFESNIVGDFKDKIRLFNVSYEGEYWPNGINKTIEVYWWGDIKIISLNNKSISGANISFKNYDGKTTSNVSSDNFGLISKLAILSYTKTSEDDIVNESNKTAIVSYLGKINQTLIDVNSNLNLTILLDLVLQDQIAEDSSSGGSGGSSGECRSDWKCDKWGPCIDDKSIRECKNSRPSCTFGEKPLEIKSCVSIKEEKKKSLFDISLHLIDTNLIKTSGMLIARISLLNVGRSGKTNVSLSYSIFDRFDKVVYYEKTLSEVETQNEFLKRINVSNLPDGKYSIYLELEYDGQEQIAYSVSEFYIGTNGKQIIAGLAVIFSLIVICLAFMFKRKLLSKYLSRRIKKLIAENKKTSRFDKEMAYEEIKQAYNRLIQSEKRRIYPNIREFFKTIDSQK